MASTSSGGSLRSFIAMATYPPPKNRVSPPSPVPPPNFSPGFSPRTLQV
jgi:hypothetical protein